MHWTRWSRSGDPLVTSQVRKRRHVPFEARFWERVERTETCWPWTAAVNSAGYGMVGRDGGLFLAHRIAFELTNGPIPDGLVVCHRCDTPRCCRPDHLFLGTQGDNLADMWAKGRGVTPTVH